MKSTPEGETGLVRERLELARRTLPEIARTATQVIVDNPGQVAVVAAGSVVLTRVLANLMRPRTPLEFLALMITCQAGGMLLAYKAIDAGLLRFRYRDADGDLVPLVPPADA